MWPPEKLYGKNFHPRRGHMTSMNAGSKQKELINCLYYKYKDSSYTPCQTGVPKISKMVHDFLWLYQAAVRHSPLFTDKLIF
jgi:hypothetical protein